MTLPIIVIGGGGHAGVVIDALRLNKAEILGILGPRLAAEQEQAHGVPLLGDDESLSNHPAGTVMLVNGIGSARSTQLRASIFQRFKALGYDFTKVVHPATTLAADVVLDEGVQVMAGAVVQTGARIGANVLINTCASVDHDCSIGHNVHIAPGVRLSGSVVVEEDVHIGTGATVIQSITIGRATLVGAGTVVTHDLPPNSVVRPPKLVTLSAGQ